MSINRLSAKNLIRKIYLQGTVGFELTPRGKSAIEALAKAETDRITKQLQEAIQQERKAKLRSATVNRMNSAADVWLGYQIPDNKLIDKIEREAESFLAAAKEIQDKQPSCQVDPENYEQKFSQYRPEVEKLTARNRSLTAALNNYAKIENNLQSLTADIKSINRTLSKYEAIGEAASQISQLKASLSRLSQIQSQLESFDRDKLGQIAELLTQLSDNYRLLENLKKPTHEFKAIKKENLSEKTIQYADPEGPVKYAHKTGGSPVLEKCGKCGATRRLTSVNIG